MSLRDFYLNETHNVGRTMPVGIILLLKKKYFFRVKQSNFENTPKKFIKLWGKALERSILVSILTNVGFSFFLSKENWIMSMLRWGKLLEKFFPHSKIFKNVSSLLWGEAKFKEDKTVPQKASLDVVFYKLASYFCLIETQFLVVTFKFSKLNYKLLDQR